MKKYLVQFYKKVAGAGKGMPDMVPVEGVSCECSHRKLTEILGKTFERFPFYYMATISVSAKKSDNHEFFKFEYVAVNEGWDGSVFSVEATKLTQELFEMIG